MLKSRSNIMHAGIGIISIIAAYSISSSAFCADAQAPEMITKATHQLTVPAGPYSVVNTATGKLITTIPITGWKIRGGMEINFNLTNVSDDGGLWPETRPATGWRHSYQSWIADVHIPLTTYYVYQWNSTDASYSWKDSDMSRETGNPFDLAAVSDGFQVTGKDKTVYKFLTGDSYNYLSTITDTHNNQIALTYGISGTTLVTRVTDPNGNYLELVWERSGSSQRLTSVNVKKSNGTVLRTYTFEYSTVINEWSKLIKINFPLPATGQQQPYVRFEYDNGTNRITKIYTRQNNGDTGELAWTYTYDSLLHKVTQVDGPAADQGRSSTSATAFKLQFSYDTSVTVGSYSYWETRIKDALWVSAYPERHREVHLYRHTDPAYSRFGPIITYVIGSQSTDDSIGSSYDNNVSSVYPGCYYSKYEWNESGTEYDCTLKKYTPPTATDSTKCYTCKWYDDSNSNTTTDNRLNLWKITNPKK